MPRFIGTETEYGIATFDKPELSPIISSTHLVVAYAARAVGGLYQGRTRWDFAQESPLKDSRGFDLRRYKTVPVVDPNALGVANVVTSCGARFYVDHAHPEWSAPETTTARDAMTYDMAGDVIVRQAVDDVAQLTRESRSILAQHDPCPAIRLFRNNTDGKGASYGSHENYSYDRSTEFSRIAAGLIPFFTTRQIVCGAGRVGIGSHSQKPGFQLSQRADFIEQEISLETTLNRGIINTRDEPHADPKRFGRLHVIVGDCNFSQIAECIKLGSTDLVLDAIEAGIDFSDLTIKDPVSEIRAVSHDVTLSHRMTLASGTRISALEMQREYFNRVRALADCPCDEEVLSLWDDALTRLADDPLSAADMLDWAAKWSLIRRYLDRGCAIDDPKIRLIDLRYAEVDPDTSIHHALVRAGKMKTLVDEKTIARAATQPPRSTRAYFRGEMMSRFGHDVLSANWDSIVVADGKGRPVAITLDNPGVMSAPDADIVASATSAAQVVELLDEKYPTLVKRI